MSIYNYNLLDSKGNTVSLEGCKGRVMLIVNTATGCGFTPQYAPIEEMYKKYHEKGLEVIDIPCNQFGGQAPGNDDEIHEFCTLHYNTTFPQMKKSDVNGENELPLYKFLKEQQPFNGFDQNEMGQMMDGMLRKQNPDYDKNSDIKWNFTKFVVDKTGNVVARFEPTTDMAVVEECIKSLL